MGANPERQSSASACRRRISPPATAGSHRRVIDSNCSGTSSNPARGEQVANRQHFPPAIAREIGAAVVDEADERSALGRREDPCVDFRIDAACLSEILRQAARREDAHGACQRHGCRGYGTEERRRPFFPEHARELRQYIWGQHVTPIGLELAEPDESAVVAYADGHAARRRRTRRVLKPPLVDGSVRHFFTRDERHPRRRQRRTGVRGGGDQLLKRVIGLWRTGTAELLARAHDGLACARAEVPVNQHHRPQPVEATLEPLDRFSFVATAQHHLVHPFLRSFRAIPTTDVTRGTRESNISRTKASGMWSTQKPMTRKSAPRRRTRQVAMPPAIGSKFALKRKFLADHADVSLELASPNVPLLTKALRNPALPIPPGAIALGDIKATADGAVALGRSTAKVTLKGHAEAAFGLGVFIDGADAIKAVAPSPELADALALDDPEATRYVAVRACIRSWRNGRRLDRAWSRRVWIVWRRKLDEPPFCRRAPLR